MSPVSLVRRLSSGNRGRGGWRRLTHSKIRTDANATAATRGIGARDKGAGFIENVHSDGVLFDVPSRAVHGCLCQVAQEAAQPGRVAEAVTGKDAIETVLHLPLVDGIDGSGPVPIHSVRYIIMHVRYTAQSLTKTDD